MAVLLKSRSCQYDYLKTVSPQAPLLTFLEHRSARARQALQAALLLPALLRHGLHLGTKQPTSLSPMHRAEPRSRARSHLCMVHAPVEERTRFRPSRALLRGPSRGVHFVAPPLWRHLGRSTAPTPLSFQHLDCAPPWRWFRPLNVQPWLLGREVCSRRVPLAARAEILTLPIQIEEGMRPLLTATFMKATKLVYIPMPSRIRPLQFLYET
jgi:hypothetical protein